jgi:hypothetical protein
MMVTVTVMVMASVRIEIKNEKYQDKYDTEKEALYF